MLDILRTLRYLWKIRRTTQGWFLTHNIPYNNGSLRWANNLIRQNNAGFLNCPIQALGVELITRRELEKYHNIVFAADNQKAPWRKALLWATRLKEADAS